MNVAEAFQKPFKNPWVLVKGVVILIVPVINILLLPGYLIRVARNTMAGNSEMPEWNEFGRMVVDSLKLFAISLAYSLLGLIVLMIALGAAAANFLAVVGGGAAESNMVAAVVAGVGAGAGLFLLGVLLLIVGGIGSTSAVLMYAKSNQFSSAFKVKEVYSNFFKGSFLKTLGLVLVLSIVISIIEAVLTIIPIIGFLIPLLVVFPMAVAFQSLLADAYGK